MTEGEAIDELEKLQWWEEKTGIHLSSSLSTNLDNKAHGLWWFEEQPPLLGVLVEPEMTEALDSGLEDGEKSYGRWERKRWEKFEKWCYVIMARISGG